MSKKKQEQEMGGAKLHMSGTAEEILEAPAKMARAAKKAAKEMAEDVEGNGKSARTSVNRDLAEPANFARATRKIPSPGTMVQDPMTGRPRKLLSSLEISLPTTLAEIAEELRSGPGGQVWHIEVRDEDNRRLNGCRIKIDAPPGPMYEDSAQMPQMTGQMSAIPGMQTDPRMNPLVVGGSFWDTSDDEDEDEKTFKREERMYRLRQMREEEEDRKLAREERRRGSSIGSEISKVMSDINASIVSIKSDLESKISDLKGSFKDWKHETDVKQTREEAAADRRIGEIRQTMDKFNSDFQHGLSELKAQLGQVNAGGGVMSAITELQKSQSESSSKVLEAMIGAITAKAEASSTDPIEKFVNSFGVLAKATGMGGFSEPKDLGTAAIEGINDGIKSFLEYKREQGESMTQEKIQEEIDKAKATIFSDPKVAELLGDAVKQALVEREKERKQIASPKQPKPNGGIPARQEKDGAPNVEAQFKMRINKMVEVILAEMEILPGEAQFIDFALSYVPKKFLAQISDKISSPIEIGKLLAPHIETDLRNQFIAKMGDAEKRNWFLKQLRVLVDEFNADQEELGKQTEEHPTENPAES